MAAHVYHTGQPCNMGGIGSDMHCQRRDSAAHALGADAQPIDMCQQRLLLLTVKRIGIWRVHGHQQRLFRLQGALLNGAAQSNAYHHRRTGIGTGSGYAGDDPVLNVLPGCRRRKHPHGGHILAAKALGRTMVV